MVNLSNNDILEIRTLNTNKKIMWVDNNMKLTIKTIIDGWLRQYKGIPLTWEDIYYEFLYETPKLFDQYDPSKGITFKTFLGLRCRYFTSNKCKGYISKKHQILNKYVLLEKTEHLASREEPDEEISIDFSVLSEMELKIYNQHFVENKNLKQICNMNNISRYKLNRVLDSIKSKISSQVKN